ncbi:MAG: F0F1 ATP synthase subunit A [Lachnospiraceae bacterium]|jgi:F-type H+-transporting ATPase subunit a|nr:F0F1 ATP synthase subunit A [Lachnospiraceae bacterium]MCI9100294.1 F0F1 ATP synthase subunit A [Lachnospiraceae bacterium]MCI9356769.1 F0F1 ATP synthase subunit A [Lachnospiraceae bacterium]
MDIDISGARIFFELPIDLPLLGPLRISETLLVSWLVILVVTGLCMWLTHDLKTENISKRQAVAEMLVEMANNFVVGNMGEKFRYFVPFVAGLFATSVVSNLIGLLGLRSPTADLATEFAWAVVVFIMITAQKIKVGGVGGYLLDFTKPIPILAPFNVLSELATPIGMAFRHFGNILSGVVINALLYAALAVASSALLGMLPGVLGDVLAQIPILDVGVPAITSVYFDWVSGVLQAFIFCMLTVMFIANAAAEE